MCVFIVTHFGTNEYPYILLCDEKSPRSVHLSRHGSSVSVSATLVPYSLRGRRPVVSGIPSEYIHACTYTYTSTCTYDVYVSYVHIHIHACVCAYVSLSFSVSLSTRCQYERALSNTTRRACCEGRSVCSPRSPRKDNRRSYCPILIRDVNFN